MNFFKVSSVVTQFQSMGGGHGHGAHGPGGGRDKGMGDIVSKYLEHALQDGKLDRQEKKALKDLMKAEQRSKGCDDKKADGCEDKENKCDDKKRCGDSKDKLLEKYISHAMRDGHLDGKERKALQALMNDADRPRHA
jgi:uncharacterized membrane protein YebE (DUF533 family)